MYNLSEKILLVIPCYNEARRLDLARFKSMDQDCHFVFVDDGSTDSTFEFIQNNLSENMHVIRNAENMGKAEAIRHGMMALKDLSCFKDIKWVGYWDADLSTPLTEVRYFLSYYNMFDDRDITAIWGSRVFKLGSKIKRSLLRHLTGRMFATLIRIVLRVNSYDTQCGAKLFKKELIDIVFKEPFVSRWIFDVELLMRLHSYKIIEYPVTEWIDVKGSKINLISPFFIFGTLFEIFKIRLKYMK
ncbi:MAG: glycosyltransferase [Candidatus Omnitrophica bacterium]|nr:glycosyltransferase [Candidatus Omnitrophota bacterium]